jgi:hypothetical protein
MCSSSWLGAWRGTARLRRGVGGHPVGIRGRVIVCVVLAVSVGVFEAAQVSASMVSGVGAATSFDQFACSLLNSSDVSGAVGLPSAAGFSGTVAPDPGAQAAVCNFAPQDGSSKFNVTIKVERYKSTSAAHNAFASIPGTAQPTQVSGFDEAKMIAGIARLRHGADVVWIDMYVNPLLPPTALMTLAAAVAKHYASPSAKSQKPATASSQRKSCAQLAAKWKKKHPGASIQQKKTEAEKLAEEHSCNFVKNLKPL